MIDLQDISLKYHMEAEDIVALDEVSLEIAGGQIVAVMGTSGSGKTTLINVVAGLQVPDAGRVVVAGRELTSLSDSARAESRLRDVGVVFQDHNLIPEFTALENVALPLRAQGEGKRRAAASAHDLLDRVGLAGLGDRYPAQLSGGQQQRVGIARALSGGKQVLLADEPTGSLDAKNSAGIFDLLREIANGSVAVIIASHDPEVRRFADRIVTMSDGRAIECRRPPEGTTTLRESGARS